MLTLMAKSSTIIGPILLYEIFSNKIECSNEKNGPLSTYLPGKSSHYIRYPNSQNIAINYDTFSLNPKWAVEHLYRDSFNEKCETKKRPPFHSEPLILEQFRTYSKDFSSTGYDRGHLVPANDFKCSIDHFNATFSLSNISPQDPTMNKGIWKWLENWTRQLLDDHDEIVVVTGPVFIPVFHPQEGAWVMAHKTIGVFPHLIHVPTHFFKFIITKKIISNSRKDPNFNDTKLGNIMTKIEAKTLLSQLEHSEGQIVSCAAFLVPNNESSAKQALNAKSITPRDFLIRISDLEALVGYKLLPSDFIASDFSSFMDDCECAASKGSTSIQQKGANNNQNSCDLCSNSCSTEMKILQQSSISSTFVPLSEEQNLIPQVCNDIRVVVHENSNSTNNRSLNHAIINSNQSNRDLGSANSSFTIYHHLCGTMFGKELCSKNFKK